MTLSSFPAFSPLRVVFGAVLAVGLTACFGSSDDKKDDPSPDAAVSDALHYAFKAPAWNAFIPCDHLVDGVTGTTRGNASVDYFPIRSGSTNAVFRFTVPHDSAGMAAPGNLKKYPIFSSADAGTGPFAFGLVVPATSARDTMDLLSRPGLAADSYTEVVGIKYVRSRVINGRRYAAFDVKGRYNLLATPGGRNGTAQPISGTYCIRFNAVSR